MLFLNLVERLNWWNVGMVELLLLHQLTIGNAPVWLLSSSEEIHDVRRRYVGHGVR